MGDKTLNITAVVLGLLFVVIGVLFLLNEYDLIKVDGYYILPLLVIGVGVAILLDAMKVYARHNQPLILAPFALCGASTSASSIGAVAPA